VTDAALLCGLKKLPKNLILPADPSTRKVIGCEATKTFEDPENEV
jgi:hypothetical protein